jgi:hypothetical protein
MEGILQDDEVAVDEVVDITLHHVEMVKKMDMNSVISEERGDLSETMEDYSLMKISLIKNMPDIHVPLLVD